MKQDPLTRNEILDVLRADPQGVKAHFENARGLRRERWGDQVFLRAVVEFANDCGNDCLYCGMRRSNHNVTRFQLADDEIFELARAARDLGIPTFFLQSAEDAAFPTDRLAAIVRRVRDELGMGVILCVGARGPAEFETLYAAGARKFIIKHETADADLFAKMKPGQKLADRIAYLKAARAAGFQIGSGTIVGLPGQTLDSLADDVILLRDLKCEMASASVFMPHADTPFASSPPGDGRLGIRAVAAMRLALPGALIPATSTFERILPGEGQYLAFMAGANVITINMTPEDRKSDYQLYTDRYFVRMEHAREVVARAGLTIAAEAM
jgi:biotin synthase